MSMYTSDVAEQVVKMTLDGTEVALKYAGAGGKKLLAGILALLRETNKSSGKIWLSTMLKSGKEIKIVAVKDSEVLKFRKEAEAYGITYVLLKNKSIDDGVTDIMIKADDMSRVNRLFERFQLTHVDMQLAKEAVEAENAPKETPSKALTKNDQLEEYIKAIAPDNKLKEIEKTNPTNGRTAESHQLRPISKETSEPGISKENKSFEQKPSVKKEIEDIEKEEKTRSAREESRSKNKSNRSKVNTKNKDKDKGAR